MRRADRAAREAETPTHQTNQVSCDGGCCLKVLAYVLIVQTVFIVLTIVPAVSSLYYPPNMAEEDIPDQGAAWDLFYRLRTLGACALSIRMFLIFDLLCGITKDNTDLVYRTTVILLLCMVGFEYMFIRRMLKDPSLNLTPGRPGHDFLLNLFPDS